MQHTFYALQGRSSYNFFQAGEFVVQAFDMFGEALGISTNAVSECHQRLVWTSFSAHILLA
jgi:hypothetical protein